jgi:CRP-like cAMP-binding protein
MPDGKRVIIGLRKEGWLLGIASILLGIPNPNMAETVTLLQDLQLSCKRVDAGDGDERDGRHWVAKLLAGGFYSSIITIRDKSLLTGRERLERFLWQVARPLVVRSGKKDVKLPIFLKQWEVAQLVSLTPQHLARLIRQLETEGILAREKGCLILRDPERLQCEETNSLMIPQEK